MTPRPGEVLSKFERRGHCNDDCARENPLRRKAQSETFRKNREQVPRRVCVVCNENFDRRPTEHTKRYQNRDTCSRLCAQRKSTLDKEQAIQKNPKICVNPLCGKTFYRRLKGESKERFKNRETCSVNCGHINRRKDPNKLQKDIRAVPKSKVRKTQEKVRLPQVQPLKIKIPDPPQPREVTVWRPESWGGSYTRKIS